MPTFAGEPYIIKNQFVHGGLALTVWDEEGPYAQLAIRVDDSGVKDNEFVLHHDSNSLKEWMKSTGKFKFTDVSIEYGHGVIQPVVEYLG